MSGPSVKLYSGKHGDQIVYEGIAGKPMIDYLAEHGPTWGIAEDQNLRMTGTFSTDGDRYDIDQDPGGASGYGAAWLNRRLEHGMNPIEIDTTGWRRWPEVQDYADEHDITVAEAIMRLVNSGLSHG